MCSPRLANAAASGPVATPGGPNRDQASFKKAKGRPGRKGRCQPGRIRAEARGDTATKAASGPRDDDDDDVPLAQWRGRLGASAFTTATAAGEKALVSIRRRAPSTSGTAAAVQARRCVTVQPRSAPCLLVSTAFMPDPAGPDPPGRCPPPINEPGSGHVYPRSLAQTHL